MSQLELFIIDNPCIGVCQSNKYGYCIGCLRSREERQTWYQMSDTQKHRVLRRLLLRRNKLIAKKQTQLSLQFAMMDMPDLFDELG